MHSDIFRLASQIFQVMERNDAPNAEGKMAIAAALIISMVDDGISKRRMLNMVSEAWDVLEPAIKAKRGLNA